MKNQTLYFNLFNIKSRLKNLFQFHLKAKIPNFKSLTQNTSETRNKNLFKMYLLSPSLSII